MDKDPKPVSVLRHVGPPVFLFNGRFKFQILFLFGWRFSRSTDKHDDQNRNFKSGQNNS